jgi:hypothetical protein
MTKRELRSKIEEYDIYVPQRTSKEELEIILDVITADAGVQRAEIKQSSPVYPVDDDDDIPF